MQQTFWTSHPSTPAAGLQQKSTYSPYRILNKQIHKLERIHAVIVAWIGRYSSPLATAVVQRCIIRDAQANGKTATITMKQRH